MRELPSLLYQTLFTIMGSAPQVDWAWPLLVTALALWRDWPGFSVWLFKAWDFQSRGTSVVAIVFSVQGLVAVAQGPTRG